MPDLGKTVHSFLTILPAIAEPAMVLYLLIVGIKTPKPAIQLAAAA
ncbi:MAG TPA: hypothetical protein VNU19_12205 [Candidatus Acidoferrum sp.]|jgi:hypothetical protein|nr:hypothetical protein [Candidatus Acidoferrum sp.]